MKLYYAAGTCSLAVHIALREVGAKFDLTAVDLAKHLTADGTDFYTISPRGYVPLLEFSDGSRHTEAAALLQYVADLDPTHALIGKAGGAHRLAVIEWLTFISSELHKGFGPLWHKETPEATRQSTKDKLAKRFAELDARLAKQPYLAETYSVADAYAFTVLNWSNFLALPMTAYPNVQAYMARVSARPAVQEAMKAEGLVK
ncbi:glutathione transferase GstA [Ralstonia mannitolilytica]|uniref:Glutathione S-transferase GST-6.0 n=1 Tax=Ralstonia mannitolilytica TaxID=105219 RepID=A0AAD2ALI1_9RALS|nr:glutathione transferase GstA [Ralstonia mannitolilytica]ATG18536.1 glutathione transferase GstA [Ralstonia pickettii]ANA33393.1 glutathione S-transferase [Ralstonia mannitolilytica]MBY4718201.1 glutathione transferase GstA [Ralstonia mannitolilytica]CAJ0681674.1 Glutathione S-transferase GST-6.0 [Ralstonia mannitolilytica]CAJ0682617.1 Glutathione S-transferase GST-6.0 [Ralstonia mannitolilytica]